MDNRFVVEPAVQQSTEIADAAWIAGRLSPFDSGVATSVVPAGFPAYARLLHPLNPAVSGQQPARWANVAAWSGVELAPGVDFPDVALPEHEPSGAEPWPGQVPQVGTLHPADLEALIAVLSRHTSTPDRCWFCMWDGWGSTAFAAGPRVQLPGRDYVLFSGSLAAVPSLANAQQDHSPNLWWPQDRAWCVATEIDLAWTYVGGSVALINDALATRRLEAQPASPEEDFRRRLPAWLTPALRIAVDELLDRGVATLHTWRGSVQAQLERPHDQVDGDLRMQRSPCVGYPGSSWQRVTECDPERLRANVTSAITSEVIQLL
jgi:hypothetical protein